MHKMGVGGSSFLKLYVRVTLSHYTRYSSQQHEAYLVPRCRWPCRFRNGYLCPSRCASSMPIDQRHRHRQCHSNHKRYPQLWKRDRLSTVCECYSCHECAYGSPRSCRIHLHRGLLSEFCRRHIHQYGSLFCSTSFLAFGWKLHAHYKSHGRL